MSRRIPTLREPNTPIPTNIMCPEFIHSADMLHPLNLIQCKECYATMCEICLYHCDEDGIELPHMVWEEDINIALYEKDIVR